MKHLNNKRFKNYFISGLVGVLFSTGCGNNSYIKEQNDQLSSEIIEKLNAGIEEANSAYFESGGHNVRGYVSLLEDNSGRLAETLYICENSLDNAFCFRYASVENPSLREEICEAAPYVSQSFLEDCLNGVPLRID